MAVWDQLKVVLIRLRDQEPGSLLGYPMPEVAEGRNPPFSIHLAAWATDAAAVLPRQFGDSVDLTVGALPYPPGRQTQRPAAPEPPAELLDPDQIGADLDGPAVVMSGDTLSHGLLLRNYTSRELEVATNGQVTATVVDPRTGQAVGGYRGAQLLPFILFRVQTGETERIPLLIGTDSIMPQLGYAIPAGTWGLQVVLTLGRHPRDSPRRRTPILPLTITPA